MLDWFQEGLGWVGMIVPAVGAIPDLLNAGIHTLRGNYTDAAMSVFFAIPIVGDAAAAGNKLKKGADKVGDVLHSVDNAVDSTKAAENAASAGKNAAKNHAAQEALEKGDIHATKITRPPRHHLFPQEHRQWFKDRGIDIDKYTIELEQGVHEAIHRQDWDGHWNKELMKRLTEAEEKVVGRKLTVREIWDIMDRLRREYKLSGDIVPYR